MRYPFTLFKKKTGNGLVWYARFWNDKAGKYTETRSSGIPVCCKKQITDTTFLVYLRFKHMRLNCKF
jgi:hypothetical protein